MKLIPRVRSSESPSQSAFPAAAFPFFEDFFNDWPVRSSIFETADSWRPVVDVLEKDGNLVLRAEIPGIEQKEIEVQLNGNVLTLKGERKLEHQEDRSNYYRMERYSGIFARSFTLPETVDRDKIKADYKDGVLTITIPQRPELKPREIPVAVH
jgi:HSP20 family protein